MRWKRGIGAALLIGALALSGAAAWHWHATWPQRRFRDGLAALEAGNHFLARDAAEQLAGRAEFAPHGHLLQGAVALRRDRPREALEELRQAVDHPQTRLRAYVLAGEAFCRLKRFRQAQSTLAEALRLDPNQVEARRWIAIAYYDVGAMDHAIVHLERLAELVPDDPRPHRLLGLIHKDLEEYVPAEMAYAESLRRDPHQPDGDQLRLELARVQVKLNEYPRALQTLSPCAPSPDVLALRAECHCYQGRRDEARALLDDVLAQGPDNVPALQLRGTMLMDEGKPQEALPPLRQAVRLQPHDFSLHFKLSQAYNHVGDETRAREHLAQSNRLKDLRREFSEVYAQALERPADADLRFRLGVLAGKLGRRELAAMWYRAALSIDPGHGPTRQALLGRNDQ